MSKAKREQLRMKFGGFCAYCGCPLPEKGWHADHVEPVWREWWNRNRGLPVKMGAPERDTIENLFPSCAACNLDKMANSLEAWRSILEQKVRVLRDNYSAFRHAERFGLVAVTEKPIVFWFERIAGQGPVQPNAIGETVTENKSPQPGDKA